jgi:tetratricopeptide (TPR) repeat protein
MTVSYVNFDLRLTQESKVGSFIELLSAPGGEECDDRFKRLPLVLPEEKIREWKDFFIVRDREFAKEIGTALFKALFPPPLLAVWKRSYKMRRKVDLRLRLDIRPPNLAALPWELLYYDYDGLFLAQSEHTPVIRFQQDRVYSDQTELIEANQALNLLIVIPTPPKGKPLSAAVNECRSFLEDPANSASKAIHRGSVDPATLEALRRKVATPGRYQILHFLGHGTFDEQQQKACLLFDHEDGKADKVDAETLSATLQNAGLRLLFLNACQTAQSSAKDPMFGVADANLRAGIPAVIAMRGEIDDESAAAFAREFYANLEKRHSLEYCVAQARAALATRKEIRNRCDWALPVLYSNASEGPLWADDTSLFGDELAQNPLPGQPSSDFRVKHNLNNPDFVEFFGRKAELAEIMETLETKKRTWIINIFGVSGSGRSALAQEVAQRCLEFSEAHPDDPSVFNGIICATMQRATLTSEGTIHAPPSGSWNFDDLFINVARTMEEHYLLNLRPEERLANLPGLLRKRRCLLILDNVDEVNDPRLDKLLATLPVPTRAIVTSHAPLNLASLPVALSKLETDAAMQLLRQEARRHRLRTFEHANPAELQELLDRTDCLPFALRWSVAQLSSSGKNLAWLNAQLARADKHQLDQYCLDKSIHDLKPPEHRLLQALSLLPQPTRARTLGEIAEVQGDVLDRALSRLDELCLLRYLGGSKRYSLLRLAQQYGLQELAADPCLLEGFTRRAVQQVYQQVQENADWCHDKAAADQLETELGNILWSIQQAYNLKDWQTVIGFWKPAEALKPLEDFLFFHGYFNESLQFGECVYNAAKESNNGKACAWTALYPMTRIHFYQGRYDEAQRWCKTSLEAFEQLRGSTVMTDDECEYAIAAAERYQGRILMENGELDQAEFCFKKGLERGLKLSQPKYRRGKGHLWAARGSLREVREQFVEARQDFETALALYEAFGDDPGDVLGRGNTLHRLGVISMRLAEREAPNPERQLAEYAQAERQFNESLMLIRSFGGGWAEREANVICSQGLLAEHRGNLEEAQRLLTQACTTFQDLALAPDLVRADAALSRVTATLTQQQQHAGKSCSATT